MSTQKDTVKRIERIIEYLDKFDYGIGNSYMSDHVIEHDTVYWARAIVDKEGVKLEVLPIDEFISKYENEIRELEE